MSITLGTPPAEALNTAIQEKLVEIGWSVPGEDTSPLSEYICLMLVNGKSQEQIAEELSGDLLGLPKEDNSATVFSAWLFDKVEELKASASDMGSVQAEGGSEGSKQEGTVPEDSMGAEAEGVGVEMEESGGPPTGPKAMRLATGPRRDRLFNQLNKAMDRSQDNLRRVRPQPGERVEKRDPPKGPRSSTIGGQRAGGPPHPGQIGNRVGANRNGMGRGGPGFGPAGGIPPHLAAHFATMNPQQQMAFYQMIDQQNQILASFMTGGFPPQQGLMMAGMPMPGMSPMPPMPPMSSMPPMPPVSGSNGFRGPLHPHQQFQIPYNMQPQPQIPQGASLFERIEAPQKIVTPTQPDTVQNGTDNDDSVVKEVTMEIDESFFEDTKGSKLEDEDPFKTACKFSNSCTRADCPFAHPTPVAVGRVNISFVEGSCPFGENCKNRKCLGAHPSPALAPKRPPIAKAQPDCKFFPNCTNPVCPFKHPEMPLCRNGVNCTRPDCHFTHVEVSACKFNPCLNPSCIYTHTEGQQQGAFDNRVWTADGSKKKDHVSERKFVEEGGEEELIIPGQQPRKVVGGSGEEAGKPPGSAASTDSSHTMHADMETVREEEVIA